LRCFYLHHKVASSPGRQIAQKGGKIVLNDGEGVSLLFSR